MGVMPMWQIRLILLRGSLKAWLRNLFSTPQARQARWDQDVAETGLEIWFEFGPRSEEAIMQNVVAAQKRRDKRTESFWLDVLEEAKGYEAFPENRLKREQAVGDPCANELVA